MKTRQTSGTLNDCVQMMVNKSLSQRRLYYLNIQQKAPYFPTSKMLENHQVDVCGLRGICVGIASFASDTTYKTPLVSDSFGPCVPVIAIGRTGTHLAHCNGSGGIMEYSSNWLPTHRVMVIRKTKHTKQAEVAQAIQDNLKSKGFTQAEMFDVPFSSSIGIIVIGSTALVYPQK
ncbi:hypothetical protein ACFONN_00905 [Dyella humi]|uniref:Uncharacterized protein n=1 Tax=Dyella humi TaxID=1770547 RepID=A0ABW8IIV6_9GAMM